MKESFFMAVYMMFIFIVVLVVEILTPKFTRKNILFGVKVPEDKINTKDIVVVKKKYVRNNLAVGIPVIVLLTLLNYFFPGTGMILFTTFGFMIVNFLVYLVSNKSMKNIKTRENWVKVKRQSVVIDTDFSKEKTQTLVSPCFFLISAAIIVLNIIMGYVCYDSLPHIIPTNWNFSGDITGYQPKSQFVIWMMPMGQIFCTAVFFLVYKIIGWSKQQISVSNPTSSVKKNKIFRRTWSIYMVIYCIMINILFTIGNFQILGLVNMGARGGMITVIVFLVVVFSSTIIISMKLGQGGANIELPEDERTHNKDYKEYSDDDDCWKLGNIIYYNPDDPSLFIEKRFGIGWTINAGRPAGMAICIGTILFTILMVVMSVFMGK